MNDALGACAASAGSALANYAAGFGAFGPAANVQLVERPMPVAAAGEVVVRVAAATVNPTDVLMLSGAHAALMKDLAPPYVAGMEFAGHVHQPGPGADAWPVGLPVMGIVNPRRPEGGAHARFIVVPAASLAPVDPQADLVACATIPMNGLTARMCLEQLDLPAGGTLLVTGAAGSVGGYVLQLARKAGLRVIADGRPADAGLLRALGADVLVPRGEGMAAAVRAAAPQGVDGLVDAAVLGAGAAALLRDGGAMVSLRRTQSVDDARIRHGNVGVMTQATNSAGLHWLADRLRDGTLLPRVAVRQAVGQAGEAFALVERGGLRGRVVLVFDR